jgi:hypothetical protein
VVESTSKRRNEKAIVKGPVHNIQIWVCLVAHHHILRHSLAIQLWWLSCEDGGNTRLVLQQRCRFCRAEKQSSRALSASHFVDTARPISVIAARRAEMSFAVPNHKGCLSSLDRKRLWYKVA